MLIILLHPTLFASVWNSPYPEREMKGNTLFGVFSSPPKHLDPVLSYNANEWHIIGQIYEPPLQYNYLKRPYQLEPLTLTSMPKITYLDMSGREVKKTDKTVAYTRYRLHFRNDIFYHEDPVFAKQQDGTLLYGALSNSMIEKLHSTSDLPIHATRHLQASDYAYAIKRMAVRQYHSPVLDTMMQYIVGLDQFSVQISKIAAETFRQHKKLDLRPYHIKGVQVQDNETLDIVIHGKYPQFLYWLSMYFFSPIPWEADLFYQQEGLKHKNLTLDTQPVGTGPYYLAVNNPNRRIVLKRNLHFHREYYPSLTPKEAESASIERQLLRDSGKQLPFIDKAVYTLEKENIPLWNKFLQGYYDASGISSEAFDQAIQIGTGGEMGLSDAMRKRGIRMLSSVSPSVFYMAFNMEDPVVGGYSPAKQKLRQAISIAQDQEEYIAIFMNGRGIAAQGPIPPGIFGYEKGKAGTDLYVYDWENGKRVRKNIETAKELLAQAGYPGGISMKTGKRLKLYYDTVATGPDDRALMEWRRKQFAKLGIDLVIRATDYNRFQEKVRKGKVQIFSWGWNADYPDPENFLFLLYGGNAVVDTNGSGINSTNYKNPEFDALFREIKTMDNTPQRLQKIEKMIKIAQKDAPWVWGVFPTSFTLLHGWFRNVSANAMANNTLKYKRIDVKQRLKQQIQWNQPVYAPLFWIVFIAAILILGMVRIYRKAQNVTLKRDEVQS